MKTNVVAGPIKLAGPVTLRGESVSSVSVKDSIHSGVTFEELITTIETNEATVDKAAVVRVFNELMRQKNADANAVLQRNLKFILAQAGKSESSVSISAAYERFYDEDHLRWGPSDVITYGMRKGYKPAAAIGNRKFEFILFAPIESDLKWLRGARQRAGEQFFRYATRSTVAGDIMPMLKVNFDKGLVYFLDEDAAESDAPIFETRGEKLTYSRIIKQSAVASSSKVQEVIKALTTGRRMLEGASLKVKVSESRKPNVVQVDLIKRGLTVNTLEIRVGSSGAAIEDVNGTMQESVTFKVRDSRSIMRGVQEAIGKLNL